MLQIREMKSNKYYSGFCNILIMKPVTTKYILFVSN